MAADAATAWTRFAHAKAVAGHGTTACCILAVQAKALPQPSQARQQLLLPQQQQQQQVRPQALLQLRLLVLLLPALAQAVAPAMLHTCRRYAHSTATRAPRASQEWR